MRKITETRRLQRDIATTVAGIHGVSYEHVRLVIKGDRVNESILTTYMEILEGKTALLQKVKELVPIEKPKRCKA
jgi:hypothetical protein